MNNMIKETTNRKYRLMKNAIAKVLLLAMVVLVFSNCNSDDDNMVNQISHGTYEGTFTVEYQNGNIFSNPVTVDFNEDSTYQSSGNVDYIPAGGSGTYTLNYPIIEFQDINFWTANFDGNLILDGQYEYSIDGDKLLIFTNIAELGLYKYELNKK